MRTLCVFFDDPRRGRNGHVTSGATRLESAPGADPAEEAETQQTIY
jgi:hypothetical protein